MKKKKVNSRELWLARCAGSALAPIFFSELFMRVGLNAAFFFFTLLLFGPKSRRAILGTYRRMRLDRGARASTGKVSTPVTMNLFQKEYKETKT